MVFGCAQGTGKDRGRWVCSNSEQRGDMLVPAGDQRLGRRYTAGNAADFRTYTYRDSYSVTRAPNSQVWWVACAEIGRRLPLRCPPLDARPSAARTRASTRKRAARSRSRAPTSYLRRHLTAARPRRRRRPFGPRRWRSRAASWPPRPLRATSVSGNALSPAVSAARRIDAALAGCVRELDAGRQIDGELDVGERGARGEYEVDRARLADRQRDGRRFGRAARARASHVQARQYDGQHRQPECAQERERRRRVARASASGVAGVAAGFVSVGGAVTVGRLRRFDRLRCREDNARRIIL